MSDEPGWIVTVVRLAIGVTLMVLLALKDQEVLAAAFATTMIEDFTRIARQMSKMWNARGSRRSGDDG